jgi:hypothetical protein
MLPCEISTKNGNFPISSHNDSNFSRNGLDFAVKDSELFLKELKKIADDEFDKGLSSKINRCFLKEITLVCRFNYGGASKSFGEQKAFITKSQYENTNFCLLSIVIVDIQINMTYLLDQASRRKLLIREEGKAKPFDDWIKNEFDLKLMGKAFFVSFMSELPTEKEARCIIAAEGFDEKSKNYIVSSTIEKCLNENKAQYSHNQHYMSERSIINVMSNFKKFYDDRLNAECLSIFVIELVILKITAINMANQKVIDACSQIIESNIKGEDATKVVLEILEGFAKSLPMWDRQHFNYFLAQEFANKVESSFNVFRYLADYEKNRIHLEQIINTRRLIISEMEQETNKSKLEVSKKETKIITIFATILSIIQVLPIFYSILLNKLDGKSFSPSQIHAFLLTLSVAGIIAVALLWYFWEEEK